MHVAKGGGRSPGASNSQLVQKMAKMQEKIMDAPPMRRCSSSDRPDRTGMADVQQIMLASRKSCREGRGAEGRAGPEIAATHVWHRGVGCTAGPRCC